MIFKKTEKKNTEAFDSFIGSNSDFKGDFYTKEGLRIDGTVEGIVNADCVVLGETAKFKGDIIARHIIAFGKVEGKLKAKEKVEIKSTGKVFGEIFANKISVMEGGVFDGKIQMQMDASKEP